VKGGEGWFLVVLSITVCMPDIYIDRVKGDGFFSFRLSNFQLYYVYALCMHTSAHSRECVCIL
jgi:hypothetical protein